MRTQPDVVGGDALYMFAGIDKARFKRPVEPGDQLQLEVSIKTVKRNIWMFSGRATVDDEVAATADLMCTAKSFCD